MRPTFFSYVWFLISFTILLKHKIIEQRNKIKPIWWVFVLHNLLIFALNTETDIK